MRSKINTAEGAPRKRRKFSFQSTSQQNSSEFLTSRGEELRESTMTDDEYFVFEELILRQQADDDKEISLDRLFESYNLISPHRIEAMYYLIDSYNDNQGMRQSVLSKWE